MLLLCPSLSQSPDYCAAGGGDQKQTEGGKGGGPKIGHVEMFLGSEFSKRCYNNTRGDTVNFGSFIQIFFSGQMML